MGAQADASAPDDRQRTDGRARPTSGTSWPRHPRADGPAPVDRIREAIAALALPGVADEATELVLGEIRSRLTYLADVGLGYLTLDRQSRTLSGGEVQRINLTTALGTSLVNTLFVLDEPSIGLHPRDIGRILGVMTRLRDAGNTLVVVEHDPQVMVAADELLEIGPGPGERGGDIVARGTPAEIAANPASVTGPWLAGRKRIDVDRPPRPVGRHAAPQPGRRAPAQPARPRSWLPAAAPDLPDRRVRLGQIHADPGRAVPGAGQALRRAAESPGIFDRLENVDNLRGVVMVDQSPIGKSSRSNPVSYVGAWDPIRKPSSPPCRGEAARLHPRHLQLQRRPRALPDLHRLGLRARRDAVPVRRVAALPGLRRQALPAGSA
jgi:excinuclease ABC subunit A